jgi:hypothetical protein
MQLMAAAGTATSVGSFGEDLAGEDPPIDTVDLADGGDDAAHATAGVELVTSLDEDARSRSPRQ